MDSRIRSLGGDNSNTVGRLALARMTTRSDDRMAVWPCVRTIAPYGTLNIVGEDFVWNLRLGLCVASSRSEHFITALGRRL